MIWNCYHLKKCNIKFTKNQHIFNFSYLLKNYIKNFMFLNNYKHLL
jgi:hypothetical protein